MVTHKSPNISSSSLLSALSRGLPRSSSNPPLEALTSRSPSLNKYRSLGPDRGPTVVKSRAMSPLSIRPLEEADLADVLSCWENASALAHSFLDDADLEMERKDLPNRILPSADTWVAERGGRVVGFIALIGDEVAALFVEPRFHHVGAGRALMDKARELHASLVAQVFLENENGLRFYQEYGFRPLEQVAHEANGRAMRRLEYRC